MVKCTWSKTFVAPLRLSWGIQRRTTRSTCKPRDGHGVAGCPSARTRSAAPAQSAACMQNQLDQLDKHGRRYIRLEQFVKLQGMAETGGQAKMLIREGLVSVNGQTETRRGRKLVQGDGVHVQGDDMELLVHFDDGDERVQQQTATL